MLWLTGGQVYDVERGAFRRADIGIDGDRIRKIGRARMTRADTSIDMAGAWLLPGFIDCHVHLTLPTDVGDPSASRTRSDAAVALFTAWAAEQTLMGGITTARDVGGWNYVEMAVREAIEAGRAKGPRLFLAGKLLSITTGGIAYYPGMYDEANGPDQVRAAARRQIAAGADLIKIMATGAILSPESEDAHAIQFTLEEIKAAVEIAGDNFKHVAAHAHACRGIHNAVSAGVDSIEHGTFADAAAWKRMAKAGTFLVPTNCALTQLLANPGIMSDMPAHLRARMQRYHKVHSDAVRLAHRLGVPIAMGTDAGTPGNHHGENAVEIALMVEEAGMTPAQAIACATANPAKLLRQESNLGSLEAGKYADIVACRENPLHDIRAVTRIAFVMKGGQVFKNGLVGTGKRKSS
jgi:imidazolonepropionase-like amidohydrolase